VGDARTQRGSFFVIFAGCARKNHARGERRGGFLSDLADFATVVFLVFFGRASRDRKTLFRTGSILGVGYMKDCW
ncbi:MAG: hypothetical protein JW892_08940, partial [Anaerolineae bacterium]|nr:hypothetical protein [Anaerolineae bacterium]